MPEEPVYGMSKDLAKYATGPITTLPSLSPDVARIKEFNEMLVAWDKRDFPEDYLDVGREFALKYAEALKALSENKESK